MDLTTAVTVDPDEAREMLRHYGSMKRPTAEDQMITNALRASTGGKLILRLTDTIRAGGQFDTGYPRIAAMWAKHTWCVLHMDDRGNVTFSYRAHPPTNARRLVFPRLFPRGTQERWGSWWQVASQVPIIPPQYRPPAYKMKDWLVLWEVEEWAKAPQPPGDPALLRPLGNDMYVVEATWDLTPLEKLVLAGRPLEN
jgi:hypothetical protein